MSEEDLRIANDALVPIFQSGDIVALIDDDAMWRAVTRSIEPEAEIRFITPDGGGMGAMGQPFRGADGLRAGWREWLEPWQTFAIEPVQVLDAGGGKVLSLVQSRGQMRGSSAEMIQEAAAIALIDAGRVVGLDLYLDHDQARREAGLS